MSYLLLALHHYIESLQSLQYDGNSGDEAAPPSLSVLDPINGRKARMRA